MTAASHNLLTKTQKYSLKKFTNDNSIQSSRTIPFINTIYKATCCG